MEKLRSKASILVADDDPTIRRLMQGHIAKIGCHPIVASNGREALEMINDEIAAVLLDLSMPELSGIECLQKIKQLRPELPVIMISGTGEIPDAVKAIKAGAMEYITKPFNLEELLRLLRNAARIGRMKRETQLLKHSIGGAKPRRGIVGHSPAAQQLIEQIEKIAQLDATVLVTGESGVGKSLAARMIHYGSSRATHPFVSVSCPALPRELLESELFGHEKGAFTGAHQQRIGRIELARGGTLFLDEIGDLPLALQPKLLNVLQDRQFMRIGGEKVIEADVRIIAATNVDLQEKIHNKEFREDLYYRLHVIPLYIPSLRERLEDIPALSHCILDRISQERKVEAFHIEEKAMDEMLRYEWPGNVRELENMLERVTAFCENQTIVVGDLPAHFHANAEIRNQIEKLREKLNLAGMSLADLEYIAINQTLEACQHNKTKAARTLGITERSIYNKLKKYQLASSS